VTVRLFRNSIPCLLLHVDSFVFCYFVGGVHIIILSILQSTVKPFCLECKKFKIFYLITILAVSSIIVLYSYPQVERLWPFPLQKPNFDH